MQTATQTPAPDVAPKTPTATYTYVGADGKTQSLPVPHTRAEIRALQAQRSQISDQLDNVSSRRSDIAEELARTGADAARTGLEQRLQLLDRRILQLEGDLARTGQQLAAAPPELVAGTEAQGRQNTGNRFGGGFAAGGFSVFAVVAVVLLVMARSWHRGPRKAAKGELTADSAQRLERLEQGMDAIAIEIERISEGQRFVTKLISESQGVVPTAPRVGQSVDSGRGNQ